MLPINSGGHAAYQSLLLEQLLKYYPDYNSIPVKYLTVVEQFWNLDLSDTDTMMQDRYSKFGPVPRLPSCMLRSYLLMIKLAFLSLTKWADAMKVTPILAIISGFTYGDSPGATTFYDFMDRLWLSDEDNLTPHLQAPKKSVKKPSKDGQKAKPIEKISVADLIQQMEEHPPDPNQPFSLLTKLYGQQFLNTSIQKGLVNPKALSVAGDGTPLVTSARPRSKRLCDCKEQGITGCNCKRYYSQPDCDIGWDSSRKHHYLGYHLYELVDAGSESDLPLFPLLAPASRHDSHGFIHAWFTMKGLFPELIVEKLLLDAAHDAMPIFEYCRQEHITPFIDLNQKRGIHLPYKNDFTIGKDGVPVCLAGRTMRHDGIERAKYRSKFRCPLSSRKHGCSCSNPCSDSKFGRTVHLATKDNPRLINIPPRDSTEWKVEYNARTSAERSIKRKKNDYHLESGRHRSSKMWYCRLYATTMLQHLDAWDLPYESSIVTLLKQVA